MPAETVPDVSVIIPAYNALPYLHRGLESLVAQTIGTSRLEIVAIDDGSSDGTGEALDEWSQRHPGLFRVVHGEASGGPAAPRNTGLGLARGRYIFFLDADDFLGDEALERLVTTADEQGSDIVMGKMVATGDRGVPESMFKRTDLDADLFTSRIYWTLAALKLFRRSFVEDNALRFPTHFPNASDQPFTALAYLRARKISVLSDYDFYHVVLRDDGQHVTKSGALSNRVDVVETMCELIASEVIDVDRRAPLLTRHFQIDLRSVMHRIARTPRAEQEALLERAQALVHEHLTPEIQRVLTPDMRVIYHLTERGLHDEVLVASEPLEDGYQVLLENGHAYALLPFFRDPELNVPDELYEVSDRLRHVSTIDSFACHEGARLSIEGTARLVNVTVPTVITLVLSSKEDPDLEFVAPVTRGDGDQFRADIDLLTVANGQPLAEGSWLVSVRHSAEGFERTWRLGASDASADELADAFVWAATEAGDGFTAGAHLSKSGRFQVDVRCRRGASAKQFADWTLAWDDAELVVRGRVVAPRSLAPVGFVLRGPDGVRRVPARHEGHELVGRVPVSELDDGSWQLRLRVGRPPAHRPVRIEPAQNLEPKTLRDGSAEIRIEQVAGPTATLEITTATTDTGLTGKAARKLRSITRR